MRAVIVLSCIVCLVAVHAAQGKHNPDDQEWRTYKSKFNKVYQSPDEESERKLVFMENKKKIEEHNRKFRLGQTSFEMGFSERTDWTRDELGISTRGPKTIQLDFDRQLQLQLQSQATPDFMANIQSMEDIPEEVDWRKVPNRVGAVRDQGKCTSSWAFTTTGLLEGQQVHHHFKELVTLSVQDVIDCSFSGPGCATSAVFIALRDLADQDENGGIQAEKDYPFTSQNDTRPFYDHCKYDKFKAIMSVGGYKLIDKDEDSIQRFVAEYGPVATAVQMSDSMAHYKSGVFKDSNHECDDGFLADQSMLIVGYGYDAKEGDYWLLKNSWGQNWGENGYLRLARTGHNLCQIGHLATIPVIG